jgi:predicted nucleic acid-binding protein
MPVGFDSTMLSLLLNPSSSVPNDPATGKPTEHARERVQGLVTRLQKQRHTVIIPAPVVAEVLTVLGPTNSDYLQIINRSRVFAIRPFDEIAAFELAFLNRDAFGPSDKKNALEPYQKIKLDRQILAVCRVARCDVFYTDDRGLITRARLCGIPTRQVSDLEVPDDARQHNLALEEHDPIPPVDGDEEAEPQD